MMKALFLFTLLTIQMASSTSLTPNTFYLLCYRRDDLKCQEAENEVVTGYNKLVNGAEYQMIPRDIIPRIEVVDCLPG